MGGKKKGENVVVSIDGKFAEKWRNLQSKELIDCFTEDKGRPPQTTEELTTWFKDNKHKVPLDADGKIVPRKKEA